MKVIKLENYHPEHEGDFMKHEFDPSKLRTIGELGLTVMDGIREMPQDYNTMETDTHFIFRLIHPVFNDGFTIYRIPKCDL